MVVVVVVVVAVALVGCGIILDRSNGGGWESYDPR